MSNRRISMKPVNAAVIGIICTLFVACSNDSSDQGSTMRANAKNLTIETGTKFAEALVAEKYTDAQLLLTKEAKEIYTPERLATEYKKMVSYGDGPVKVEEFDGFMDMDDWPARQPQDIGSAYIPISGSDFSEAVTVVVSDENGSPKIREIEWGRP
jgi:hypothetical protein